MGRTLKGVLLFCSYLFLHKSLIPGTFLYNNNPRNFIEETIEESKEEFATKIDNSKVEIKNRIDLSKAEIRGKIDASKKNYQKLRRKKEKK